MRQDFFTFTPLFKLFIAGNHKPGLRGVDEAMRRRLNLIPFTVTIPAAERDHTLPEKLKAEWPGILAWAIEGCLHWQRTGLRTPAAVIEATADYLDAEDAIGLWIAEACYSRPTNYDTATNLFRSWTSWAETAGEHAGSQKRFSQALAARGFVPRRDGSTGRAGFDGIAVKPPAPSLYEGS
jgi:putative DNA primase/helicase